ncbi:VOC family protein [Sporichthya polymorpha]|uniref:VOC family protein n=1 Tax=Sporichthya polymorpha TaxID=35751 RepID=UPI00037329E4|nr:VOC family protein [Sporichthya polymorpha]
MNKPITPCLWFDGNAREAAEFYTSVFPNSKMGEVGLAPDGGTPSNEAGAEMVVEFTLNGQPFTGLNGGPMFTFSEAVSFQIFCADQAEVDHYFDALVAGGEPSYCGWLKDKFGLSWQVVPLPVLELLNGPKAQIAFEAINKPEKIVIADVQAACA